MIMVFNGLNNLKIYIISGNVHGAFLALYSQQNCQYVVYSKNIKNKNNNKNKNIFESIKNNKLYIMLHFYVT